MTTAPSTTSTQASSLWAEALRSLSETDRAHIDFASLSRSEVLKELLSIAEAKKAISLKKRWSYTKDNETIYIRDKLEKITKWINRFKEVGSTVVQYDPVNAALPWACVLLVLQITTGDIQTFGMMVDGLETVTQMIALYSNLENIYLQQETLSPLLEQLRLALTKLYVSILRYLVKARQYFTKKTAVRVLKSVIVPPESAVQLYLDVIAKKATDLNRCVLLVQGEAIHSSGHYMQSISTVLNEIRQPISASAAIVTQIHDKISTQERQDVLDWLSRVPCSVHHQSEGKDYLPGSGTWLLEHEGFQSWVITTTPSLLWLHGQPGCGKTKIVYRAIEEQLSSRRGRVAYFYCTRNPAEPERGKPTEILASLLRQLSLNTQGEISAVVIDSFKKRQTVAKREGTVMTHLNLSELRALTLKIIRSLSEPVTLFIDALDECDPKERHDLLAFLDRVRQVPSQAVKIFVSSRDDGDLCRKLRHEPNIYIRPADNRDDINRYIDHVLARAVSSGRFLDGAMSDSARDQVSNTLKHKAHGMFRWVALQIDNLCDASRIKIETDVLEEVGQLPTTLGEAYNQTYERVLNLARTSREVAMRVLKWLMCAQKMLSERDLIASVTFAHESHFLSSERILDICCNLVVLDDQGVFRFAHLSVREYLETLPAFAAEECNACVLERCIEAYRNTTDHWRHQKSGSHDDIVQDYAMLYWPGHLKASLHPKHGQALPFVARRFIFDDPNRPIACVDFPGQQCEVTTGSATLKTTEAFREWMGDVRKVTQYSANIDCDTNLLQRLSSITNSHDSPLFLGCAFDVLLILEWMVDIDTREWKALNDEEDQLLDVALKFQSVDTVNWLLNSSKPTADALSRALALAIEQGDSEMTKTLLHHRASGFLQDKGSSPLQLATYNGDQHLVKMLLESLDHFDAHIFAECMIHAYREDHELFEVFRKALEILSPPHFLRVLIATQMRSQDDAQPYNPFHSAEDLPKLLLEYANKAESAGLRSIQRLHEMLDDEFENLRVSSAGYLGLSYPEEGIVPVFILAISIADKEPASGVELLKILLLLDGCDLDNGDSWSATPGPRITLDSERFDTKLWMFLLSGDFKTEWEYNGYDDDDSDDSKSDPNNPNVMISSSTSKHSPELFAIALKLLKKWINQGANVNMTKDNGETPLMVAARYNHELILELLQVNGAHIHTLDRQGRSALSNAIQYNNQAAVRTLIKFGADPNRALLQNVSALAIAWYHCHHEMILVLRELGALRPGLMASDTIAGLPFLASLSCTSCVQRMLVPKGKVESYKRVYESGYSPRVAELLIDDNDSALTGFATASQIDLRRQRIEDMIYLHSGDNPLEATQREDGITLVHAAAVLSMVDGIPKKLRRPDIVNAVDNEGFTALHYAAARGCHDTVRNLLQYGAEPAQQDFRGRTALHLAIMSRHLGLWWLSWTRGNPQKLLIEAMARDDLDLPDCDGNTALHLAVKHGCPHDDMELLITAGAQLGIRNHRGWTQLELAVSLGRSDTVEILRGDLNIFHDSNEVLLDSEDEGDYLLHPEVGLIGKLDSRPLDHRVARKDDEAEDKDSVDVANDSHEDLRDADSGLRKLEQGDDSSYHAVEWFAGHGTDQWSVLSGTQLTPLRPLDAVYHAHG